MPSRFQVARLPLLLGANDVDLRRETPRGKEPSLSEAHPQSQQLTAVGVVTGHTSRSSYGLDHRTTLLFPSVRFQTANGRIVDFQSKVGSNAPPKVGEEVTVYYDPERPEDANLSLGSTFRPNLKLLPVVFGVFFGVMALMFLSVFALVLWVSW
jgi:hypothetical protein